MKEHFIIPENYMEQGYLFSGSVSYRNAVEGGIFLLLGVFLCGLLPLPGGIDSITYYILICGPLGLVGLFGVQGDPLSSFIWDYFKWRRRRKPYFFSGHSEAYTQEAADLLMDSPQMRDILADAMDKIRQRLSAEDIEYVEGENFQFALDPEQEALRQAQEEILAKKKGPAAAPKEKSPEAEEKPLVKSTAFRTPDNATSVNAEQVSKLLVLDDLELEWEDNNG